MRRPFMAMCIAGVAGIVGALMLPSWIGWFMLPICVCIYILINKAVSETPYGVWLAVFLFVGFCRVWVVRGSQAPDAYVQTVREGEILSFEGRIKRVTEKPNSIWLTMQGDSDVVLAILSRTKLPEDEVFYKGQVYAISGEVKLFTPASNPGQFDESVYYRSMGISYKVMVRDHKMVSEGDLLHRALRGLEDLRRFMGDFYQRTMSEDGAGVMMAAVLGDRSAFGEDVRRVWQQNGWMHLVTVSGLHLSFIAMGIYRRLRRMTAPLAVASVFATLSMLAYGYMTDFGDSMIRACIMMFLCIMAMFAGRRYDRPTALAFAAWIMLLIRPERLFSSGFLLSFMAILGTLASLDPLVEGSDFKRLSGWMKIKVKFKESLRLQTGIFLTTLPVIAGTMFEVPVFGFFYNLFMIPLAAMIVPAAFAAGLTGVYGIGVLKNTAGWLMGVLDKMLGVVVRLPSKTWICGCPKWWQMAVYLLVLMFWILPKIIVIRRDNDEIQKRRNWTHNAGIRKGILWMKRWGKRLLPVFAVCFLIGIRDHSDRILFIDVGQGDGICFMSGDGETVMLDGGSSDVKDVWQYRIVPVLKYYGRDQVDVWFLTHGDTDHTSGIHKALMDDTIKVGSIISPMTQGSEELMRIQAEAIAAGHEVLEIYPSGKLHFGCFDLTCLYPDRRVSCSDENDRSLVLSMTYTSRGESYRALFTGDLGSVGEKELLKDLPEGEPYDLLKAGHHGSKTSSSEELLARIRPRAAVISCGFHNSYGHPHRETLERLEAEGVSILRTDEMGAVEVLFDQKAHAIIYSFFDPDKIRRSDHK